MILTLDLVYLTGLVTLCSAVTGSVVVYHTGIGHYRWLPCPSPFNFTDKVNIKWKKTNSSAPFCEYFLEKNIHTLIKCKSQYVLTGSPPELYIKKVENGDSGQYHCSISRVIPPPNIEKCFSFNLIVKVPPRLTIQTVNSSGQGSCIHLLCNLEGTNYKGVIFTWTLQRSQKHLPVKQSLSEPSSLLRLCQPEWKVNDHVFCTANVSAYHSAVSESIRLQVDAKLDGKDYGFMIIVCLSAIMGIIIFVAVTIGIYKRIRRKNSSSAVTYNNQIYENYGFSRQTHAQTCQITPSREPSIYEN